ncbi:MAG: PIN domain-containing protein, partial [Acidimicrobiales bacterium]
RAARVNGMDVSAALDVLDFFSLVPLDETILRAAIIIGPHLLRSLDVIHVSAAATVPELEAVLTYDHRLAETARLAGLVVSAPSAGQ